MVKEFIKTIDLNTNEETVREMTNAEFAQYQADQDSAKAKVVEAEAKAAAKSAAQAKLAAIGLTVEDLQALGL